MLHAQTLAQHGESRILALVREFRNESVLPTNGRTAPSTPTEASRHAEAHCARRRRH